MPEMTAPRSALSITLVATLTMSMATGTMSMATGARAEERILGYVTDYRWRQVAEEAANEQVTYEVCGWGFIDLLTPFLLTLSGQGFDVGLADELARRYEDSARERRRTEAVLTAHGANAPTQRTTGLHATGGCSEAVRARIERKAAMPRAD